MSYGLCAKFCRICQACCGSRLSSVVRITYRSGEKGEEKAHTCDKAFNEKAGRSQDVSKRFVCINFFSAPSCPVAILPSAVIDEHCAGCKLGVLVSAGAATC